METYLWQTYPDEAALTRQRRTLDPALDPTLDPALDPTLDPGALDLVEAALKRWRRSLRHRSPLLGNPMEAHLGQAPSQQRTIPVHIGMH
jgi:hypothetical protein